MCIMNLNIDIINFDEFNEKCNNKKYKNSKNIKDKKNKKTQKNINKRINDNNQLYEMNIPKIEIDNIFYDLANITDMYIEAISSYYKTQKEFIDIIDREKFIFRVYDISGDIMKNNRAFFDICLLDVDNFNRVKDNIIEIAIYEFCENLPKELEIFNIFFNVLDYVDKEKIKEKVTNDLTEEQIINIISSLIEFNFDNKFGDFYIWIKK